jgi:hypothetical protein
MFKAGQAEVTLNLDGNAKPDKVIRFAVTEKDRHFYRRALIFDAPKKIESVKDEQWLEPCQEGGEEPGSGTITYDKAKIGGRDLLISKSEDGTSGVFQYFKAEDGKLVSVFKYSNPTLNGHFNETRKKGLSIRIVGDGELVVAGETIDLDAKALKARCRVRELYIQLKYEWDTKAGKFKEVDQGCVMDSAID